MTTTEAPAAEPPIPVVGIMPYAHLSMQVTLVIHADDDPLPEVAASEGRAVVRFRGAGQDVTLLTIGSPHARAAWLSALGASLTALAREVEESAR